MAESKMHESKGHKNPYYHWPRTPELLMPPPSEWKGQAEVVRPMTAPIRKTTIEHAGRAYEDRLRQQQGKSARPKDGGSDDPRASPTPESEAEAQRWALYKARKVDLEDFYALLNLEDVEFEATNDEIKNAYRKASLLCHPDKADMADRENAEKRYKAIQKAYEHLSDRNKRAIYDSSIEFNDDIPTDKQGITADTFFAEYEAVFKRNAKFSANRPVPPLGDINTPWEQVNRFYDFWFSFQSWREFHHLDEFNVEDGQSREEKRWMERENSRLRAGAKKEEVSRIRRLVEDAFRKDPRVQAMKKAEKDERDQKKREKEEVKRKKDEEKELLRKQEEEAKLREKEAVEEAKKTEKIRREQMKRWRKSVRGVIKKGVLGPVDEVKLEELLEKSTFEKLKALAEKVCPNQSQPSSSPPPPSASAAASSSSADSTSSEPAESQSFAMSADQVEQAKQALHAQLREMIDEQEKQRLALQEKLAAEKLAKRKEQEQKVATKDWTLEEESMLAKAIQRYPGGAATRWQQITDFLCEHGPVERSVKEVIAKAKEFETRKSVKDNDAFDNYLKKLSNKRTELKASDTESTAPATAAAATVPAAAPASAVTAPVLQPQAVATPAAAASATPVKPVPVADKPKVKPSASGDAVKPAPSAATPAAPKSAGSAPPAAAKAAKAAVPASAPAAAAPAAVASANASSSSSSSAAPAAAAASAAGSRLVWTADEQAAFESALRTVPKTDDRWDLIAAAVKTKNKKQCIDRFKEIRAQIMAQKK